MFGNQDSNNLNPPLQSFKKRVDQKQKDSMNDCMNQEKVSSTGFGNARKTKTVPPKRKSRRLEN